MPLNILIVGAGIGGPALASLLTRSNPAHNITVIERSSSLRTAGQQIDIKAQGVPILRKMGILEAIRSVCVAETGLEIVDTKDKVLAQFGITSADKKGFTLTSEYEILRGDMVKVLFEDSLVQRSKVENDGVKVGALTYEFDKSITFLSQSASSAEVTFSTGQTASYDLIVAADGQGSRTRRLAFGEAVSDAAFKTLGIHAAYYSIPRLESEGGLARAHFTQSRFLLTRTSNRPVTGAYLFSAKDTEKLRKSYKESIKKQKDVWKENLKGVGWQEERFVEGLEKSDDFYAHEQGQVKMPNLYKGRVVLLGDSGYCPSPFTGLGTTSALIGAYMLAGELARQGNDVDGALKKYEELVRAPIDVHQQLPMGGFGVFFPSSKLGVWVLNGLFRGVYMLGIDKIMTRFMDDGKGRGGMGQWGIPEYKELNLEN